MLENGFYSPTCLRASFSTEFAILKFTDFKLVINGPNFSIAPV